MPVRLLRPGINDSERVDQLDAPAEVFYRRLMSVVDDYGCYDARPSILKSHLYPLRTATVREADITRWSAACAKAGLIVLYKANGKPYLQLLGLGEPRAKNRKYPPPPENICAQTQTDVTDVPPSTADSYSPAPNANTVGAAFAEFWSAWPDHERKEDPGRCEKAWNRAKLDAQKDAVMASLRAWKNSELWTKDDGQFICAPLVWIHKGRWKNTPKPRKPEPAGNGFEPRKPSPQEMRGELGMTDAEIAQVEAM